MNFLKINAILVTILLFSAISFAFEDTLAGITVGMSRSSVVERFGANPQGKMIPMLPIVITPPVPPKVSDTGMSSGMGSGMMGGETVRQRPLPTLPPSMIFHNALNNSITTIGSSTTVVSGASGGGSSSGSSSSSVPSLGMGMDMSSSGSQANIIYLPTWAYNVRVNALTMDQEHWIYRINDSYSIGFLFEQNGGDWTVSDIIVCSTEPASTTSRSLTLTNKYNIGGRKEVFSPRTGTSVTLGSSIFTVFKEYGWTENIFPFVSKTIDRQYGNQIIMAPIQSIEYKITGNQESITPNPEVFVQGDILIFGNDPVVLVDGSMDYIGGGMTRNCLMFYPQSSVAFTIIDFLVVRIQVGNSVVIPPAPPEPPKSESSSGSGVPGSSDPWGGGSSDPWGSGNGNNDTWGGGW